LTADAPRGTRLEHVEFERNSQAKELRSCGTNSEAFVGMAAMWAVASARVRAIRNPRNGGEAMQE
jgi:hypothetical protein